MQPDRQLLQESVRKQMIGCIASGGTRAVRTALTDLRASSLIPFLICVEFLCQAKRQRMTYEKNFNADKKRDKRRCTQMLSDHVPIRGIPMGPQSLYFPMRC